MSGIVALLQVNGAPVDQPLLAAMTAAQRFRGPDGEGLWHQAHVGFGHTLHKTTLEAERESQPAAKGGRLFITADARIDARDELCAHLRDRGVEARTDATDPELILHAYDAWGERCVEHLLGDFSFALWDAPSQKLVCAVDQLGVKPLFYANRGGLFAAANSLECVRLHPHVRSELSERAVGDFLLFGCYQDRDVTIYRDIKRIPPGHYFVVERGELRLQRYFSLPEPEEARFTSEAACLEQFQDLLGKAVRDRLRTPRVAVYMSGGVDSPLVALTAKRELARKFPRYQLEAFTAVYDHLIPDDERHYASLVAQSLGIPIHFSAYDDGELFDWADSFTPPEPLDWPSAAPSLRQTAEVARRFPVVLTGWDGDALLYASLRTHWHDRIKQGRFATLAHELGWYVREQRALPPIGVRTRIKALRDAFSRPQLPAWLDREFRVRAGLSQRWHEFHAPYAPTSSRAPSRRNLVHPAWGPVFTHADPSFARTALESRHPLADLRIVRFCLALPTVPWCVDKQLLRRSLTTLPAAISIRPKTPLRGDPDQQRFRSRGLHASQALWATDALRPFVDLRHVARVLRQPPETPQQLTALFRVVGFGVWLGLAQSAARSPRELATR